MVEPKDTVPQRRSTAEPLDTSAIVGAALRLLDDVGLDGLTTRRLGEALGISGPSLYWHFQNKKALLRAMAGALLQTALPPELPQPASDVCKVV